MEDLESLLSRAVDYIVFFLLLIRDTLTSFLYYIFNIELTLHNMLFLLISFIMFTILISLIYVLIKSSRKKPKEPVLESPAKDKPLELPDTSMEVAGEEIESAVVPIEAGVTEEVESVVAPVEERFTEEVESVVAPVEERFTEDEAVVRCKNCDQLVPRTVMCIYCGAPIEPV
jgi:hypothetical protein